MAEWAVWVNNNADMTLAHKVNITLKGKFCPFNMAIQLFI